MDEHAIWFDEILHGAAVKGAIVKDEQRVIHAHVNECYVVELTVGKAAIIEVRRSCGDKKLIIRYNVSLDIWFLILSVNALIWFGEICELTICEFALTSKDEWLREEKILKKICVTIGDEYSVGDFISECVVGVESTK